MGSLFQELKRRKVFRVAVAYAVVAWVLIQISGEVLPALQMPEWTVSFVTVLLLLGFPVALLLGWAFELTPDGVKADTGAQAAPAASNNTDRKLTYVMLGLLVLLGGLQLVDRFGMDTDSSLVIDADNNNSTANTSERVRRATLNIGPMLPGNDSAGAYSTISISPDGTRLAFTSLVEGKTQLNIRELNQLQSRTLGAPIESLRAFPVFLAFSPDSEWLAYSSASGVNKISIADGSTQQLFAGEGAYSLYWAEDKTIVFSTVNRLRSVPDSGGASSLLIASESTGVNLDNLTQPKPLPGGNDLLLTRSLVIGGAIETGAVELLNFESGDTQLLIPNAYGATYSPTGHIVFMRSGDLWAVPFKLDAMQINGAEVRVIEAIDGSTTGGGATYTLSSSGDLIYLPEVGGNQIQRRNTILSWVDRTGAETPLEIKPQNYVQPRLSPDGSKVAVVVQAQPSSDIWAYDLVRSTLSRVTYEGLVQSPLWSPTGNELIFTTPTGIRSASVNGIGESEVLLSTPASLADIYVPSTFSPDSMQLVYSLMTGSPTSAGPEFSDILSLSMAPEHTSSSVIATDFIERDAAISPNGLWLAYTSNEAGRDEVFVRPYPDTDNDKHLVSTEGGNHPQWATDTGELFYQNETDAGTETYTVGIAPGSDFVASIPELLFTSDHFYYRFFSNYSVAADGQRFMMLTAVEGAEPIAIDTNLVLIDNFAAELIRRVPADAE